MEVLSSEIVEALMRSSTSEHRESEANPRLDREDPDCRGQKRLEIDFGAPIREIIV